MQNSLDNEARKETENAGEKAEKNTKIAERYIGLHMMEGLI